MLTNIFDCFYIIAYRYYLDTDIFEPLTLTTAQHKKEILKKYCSTSGFNDNLTKHYYTATHQISKFLNEILIRVEIIS